MSGPADYLSVCAVYRNEGPYLREWVAFHRAMTSGEDPVTALRSAQLAALADPDAFLQNPANWASFTVIGRFTARGRIE